MEDRDILDCIRGLVAEEHWLRDQRERGLLSEDLELRRLESIEENLDQLWATLRQRRAMRAEARDPGVIDLAAGQVSALHQTAALREPGPGL